MPQENTNSIIITRERKREETEGAMVGKKERGRQYEKLSLPSVVLTAFLCKLGHMYIHVRYKNLRYVNYLYAY